MQLLSAQQILNAKHVFIMIFTTFDDELISANDANKRSTKYLWHDVV